LCHRTYYNMSVAYLGFPNKRDGRMDGHEVLKCITPTLSHTKYDVLVFRN